MADDPKTEKGLAWPEEYRDLLPLIRGEWGVEDEIYLLRKLSGKSGALVYAADMTCKSFKGQAILKLDRAPDPEWQEETEADRHRRAYEAAPDFGAEHLPQLLHSLHHSDRLAILSTIAGRGLEYAVPWVDCTYDQQMSVVRRMSAELLEEWNRDYAMAEGMHMPQDLLHRWLDYRLDPAEGRIHGFIIEQWDLQPTEPSFVFEGHWYPNPLAFALGAHPLPDHVRMRAARGSQHCDLHGNNVLVGTARSADPTYYLIDLAMYQNDQYLFYDHAYFELSYILQAREAAAPASWNAILYHLSQFYDPEDHAGLRSDDRGLIQLVDALREEVQGWVDRHEGHRLSYMQGQYLLARVAAGLSFTHKQLSARARRKAFVYAAFNLKDYLQLQGVDWPKHGPALPLSDGTPGVPVPDTAPGVDDTPPPPTTPAPRTAAASAATVQPPQIKPKSRATVWLSAAAALVLVLATAGGLWFWRPWAPIAETSTADNAALPAVVKPSVVVLPFATLTPGDETKMFADGMTSAITAALAAVPELFVIARGSALEYKGQTAEIKEIAKHFNVRYVLEGTLQRSNQSVRVVTELIDGKTGENIWGRSYDRKADDFFALQDEIALDVLIALQVKLTEGYEAAIIGESTKNLKAYLLYIRARRAFRNYTEQSMAEVQRLADQITAIDPKFRLAYVLKARALISLSRFGRGDKKKALETAVEVLNTAAKLDEHISNAERAEILIAEAIIDLTARRFDEAIKSGLSATELAPNNADLLAVYGFFLFFVRDYDESILYLKQAMRIRPIYPSSYALYLSRNYAFKGDTKRAIKWAKRAIDRAESSIMKAINLMALAFAYYQAGQTADAKKAVAEARVLAPHFSLHYYKQFQYYKYPEDWKRFADALKASGVPA
ncbi:MAG: hypothetical protein MJE12_11520 [Alphaproteobacteria bacterium]|nr:hypothetical protein [Alphaproteobacteria bacterium]